ncbi:type II secretion system protein [Actinoplanes oblitus]|uniref:Type II secretion system protein n=1 Tax=Actinoplanes oblitus TaxID=3040509 RepID=A0ABY8WHX2_9ACTN|nr:type II secretion system protein [Actinoplanes oblitus]WIM97420.1 type II secretion system protein [Actinoplanes oblitus]
MQNVIDRLAVKRDDILAKKDDDKGFTLIELLVVVVIIGVLVAIAVPVYLNYRQGAADKSAQSDVRGAISAVEQYYTNNGNAYPGTAQQVDNSAGTPATSIMKLTGSNGDATITLSDKTKMQYYPVPATATAPAGYRVCAVNTGGSGKYYVYDSGLGGSVKASSSINSTNFNTCG